MELLDRLSGVIAVHPAVLVAYSGGVDSALVAKVAFDLLEEKSVALTALSPSFPSYYREETRRVARWIGIRHLIAESKELEDPNYRANPVNRCYFCKTELYSLCERMAGELGIPVVLNGFNRDDQSDWRPGFTAQKEFQVRSPLLEAGMGKDEVRKLAQALGLPIWDKPASPCLSSRFPYGTTIDERKLKQVDTVESFLHANGLREFRARYFGEEVRLELGPEERRRFEEQGFRDSVAQLCRSAGFQTMTVDSDGIRSGRFNPL